MSGVAGTTDPPLEPDELSEKSDESLEELDEERFLRGSFSPV